VKRTPGVNVSSHSVMWCCPQNTLDRLLRLPWQLEGPCYIQNGTWILHDRKITNGEMMERPYVETSQEAFNAKLKLQNNLNLTQFSTQYEGHDYFIQRRRKTETHTSSFRNINVISERFAVQLFTALSCAILPPTLKRVSRGRTHQWMKASALSGQCTPSWELCM
jgi:hypothetical protein